MVFENNQDDVLLADLRRALRSGSGAAEGSPRSQEASVHAFDLHPGSQLDGYEIVDLIGHGGTSMVYRARDGATGPMVAMKVIPRPGGALMTAQFRREMEAAALLKHPNILPVTRTGQTTGCLYVVTPLCHPLPAIEPSAPVPVGQESAPPDDMAVYCVVARQLADVADALAHAHERGVIHRDVKPNNILVGGGGRWQLCDFGLARIGDTIARTTTLDSMGTPSYASPEQLMGRQGDLNGQTDVYSLGATLYEVLTGCPPFSAPTLDQLVHKIRFSEPRPLRAYDSRIPIQLETICLRAMRKDPRQRYQSVGALSDDLNLFCQARPILGRRVSRMEKLSGHLRFRRGFVLAGVATCTLALLLVLVTVRNAAIRTDRADQTIAAAFDRLAYSDYRDPEAVKADVQAALPDASAGPLPSLTQALVALGESHGAEAISHLDDALTQNPNDPTALYMLAWARWRQHDRAGFDDAWARAEQSPVARTGAAWFFRGLATHRRDPNEAILSYRKANELRTKQHEFFPQALLHLARARNQLLYRDRSLAAFEETQQSLSPLIDSGNYGAYPLYLLSIAYRLASDIDDGSDETARDRHRTEFLDQAIHWAQEGQRLDPSDLLLVTAEAEALEAAGQFAEAFDARSIVIDRATTTQVRCEAYHYRWRLAFWLGDYETAMEDVSKHAACMPTNWSYKYVFPAMIDAAAGRQDEAVQLIATLTEDHSTDAMAVIWSASALRLIGEPAAARDLLQRRRDELGFGLENNAAGSEDSWLRALYECCLGERAAARVPSLGVDEAQRRATRAVVLFHAAVRHLSEGSRDTATALLDQTYRSFDGELGYTYHAKLIEELDRQGRLPGNR